MVATPAELISRSEEQLQNGNKQEALATALAATNAAPASSDAWWQLALVREALGDTRNAIPPLRKTVELEDIADGAWARLGRALFQVGEDDEAKTALLKSLSLNDEQTVAISTLTDLLWKENNADDDDFTISLLERLELLVGLSLSNRIRLGNLHHRQGHPLEAITHWKKVWHDKAAAFNVGLGYNHAKVSQDLDALDIWGYLTQEHPEYELPKTELAKLLPRLTELEVSVLRSKNLYMSRVPYEIYICPIELLNIDPDDIYDLDEKKINTLKRSMLSEIELEDGRIEWAPDLTIDKSRAIATVEAFIKDEYAYTAIHQVPTLRRFLTHGDIQHFTAGADFDKAYAFNHFFDDEDVQRFLGKFFVPQFDRCLTLAIEKRDMRVIECLLDGRRWVAPEQDDLCFEGARRAVKALIQPLQNYLENVGKVEPTLTDVTAILDRDKAIDILNFLPLHFEDIREELIGLIRSLCIELFRHHQNADLSKGILQQADRVKFRSAKLSESLSNDHGQLDEIIAKQRADEVRLTQGGKSIEITKDGVRRGDTFIKTSDIDSFRCGTLLQAESGGTKATFSMNFWSPEGANVEFAWTTKKDLEKQKEHFDGLVRAALSYVVPGLVDRCKSKILKGSKLTIGPCIVSREGVQFETSGWFRRTRHDVSWSKAGAEMKSGNVRVFDKTNPKTYVELDIRLTDNALVLLFLTTNGELK